MTHPYRYLSVKEIQIHFLFLEYLDILLPNLTFIIYIHTIFELPPASFPIPYPSFHFLYTSCKFPCFVQIQEILDIITSRSL